MPDPQNVQGLSVIEDLVNDPIGSQDDLAHGIFVDFWYDSTASRERRDLLDALYEARSEASCRLQIISGDVAHDLFQVRQRRLCPDYLESHWSSCRRTSW